MQIITLISDFGVRLNRARYILFISCFYDLFSRQSSAIKLNSLNFDIYRPKIICIEIIDSNIEITQTYKFLKNLKYNKVWSSKANINHIFVDGLNV